MFGIKVGIKFGIKVGPNVGPLLDVKVGSKYWVPTLGPKLVP